MTSKIRLLASLALGVVGAASAHAQAFGFADAYAQVNLVGFYTLDGRVATGSEQSLGSYYAYHGPYATSGNYAFSNYVGWLNDGTFVQASGYDFAAPLGSVDSSALGANSVEFTNNHVYGIIVDFYGTTFTSATAVQNHVGDSAGALGIAELQFANAYTSYAIQSSETDAIADNLFGIGNYWLGDNYDIFTGDVNGSDFYGFGSPGYSSRSYSETRLWEVYILPYSSIAITEVINEAHYAYSTQPGTPGPAAVAPFAIGLLGALRRRSKKR